MGKENIVDQGYEIHRIPGRDPMGDVRRPPCASFKSGAEDGIRWFTFSFALSLVLVLSGCSLGLLRPAPVKNYYLLDPPVQASKDAPAYPFAIKVTNFEVAPHFQERGLVYRLDEQRYESDFYNQFFVAPRSMVTTQIAQWLGQRQIFAAVLTPASALDASYTLEGLVNQMYADLRPGRQPAAVFEMQAFLTHTLDRTIVLERSYAHTVFIPNQSATSIVKGFSEALAQCLDDLERDLRALNLKP